MKLKVNVFRQDMSLITSFHCRHLDITRKLSTFHGCDKTPLNLTPVVDKVYTYYTNADLKSLFYDGSELRIHYESGKSIVVVQG